MEHPTVRSKVGNLLCNMPVLNMIGLLSKYYDQISGYPDIRGLQKVGYPDVKKYPTHITTQN